MKYFLDMNMYTNLSNCFKPSIKDPCLMSLIKLKQSLSEIALLIMKINHGIYFYKVGISLVLVGTARSFTL